MSSSVPRVYYGGTFDPVHHGHLAIARAARDALQAEIRMLPAADPPHRPTPGASAADRVEMLRLAIQGQAGLVLDVREIERGGRSWTVDTLLELRARYGADAPIAWLVGADSFAGLHTWKDWRGLFELTHFVVAERVGSPLDGLPAPEPGCALEGRWASDPEVLHRTPAGRIYRLHQPLQMHSATELRHRVAAGEPWEHLLPARVADYIRHHGLYGCRGGAVEAVIGS